MGMLMTIMTVFVHVCRWISLWQMMEACTLGMLWCWWTWGERTGSAVQWASTQTLTVWRRILCLAFMPHVESVQEEVFRPAHALPSSLPGTHTNYIHIRLYTHGNTSRCKPVTLLVRLQCRWQSWRVESAFWAKFFPENNKWLCQGGKWTNTRVFN